ALAAFLQDGEADHARPAHHHVGLERVPVVPVGRYTGGRQSWPGTAGERDLQAVFAGRGHLGRALEGYLLLPLRAGCVEARPGLEVVLLLEIEEDQVGGSGTPLDNAAVRPRLLVVGRRIPDDRVEDPDQRA